VIQTGSTAVFAEEQGSRPEEEPEEETGQDSKYPEEGEDPESMVSTVAAM